MSLTAPKKLLNIRLAFTQQRYVLSWLVCPNTTQTFDRVMRIRPNTIQIQVFTVMKALVNFKTNNLKVVGSNPTPQLRNTK